jgi:hypothetical protein
MLCALFEVLFLSSVEGLWHVAVLRASRRNGVPSRQGPYDWKNDPVYQKNLQRLIERNRQFEESRNEPHS